MKGADKMGDFDKKLDDLTDKLFDLGKKITDKAKEHITEEDQQKIKEKSDELAK